MRARSNGHQLHVGGPRLLELLGSRRPEALAQFAAEAGARGQSVVYLVRDEKGALFMSLSTVIVAVNAQLLRRVRFTSLVSEISFQ